MMYYVPHSDSIRRLDRFKTLVLMLMVALLIPVLWVGREQALREQQLPVSPAVPEVAPPPVSLDTPADGSTFSTDSATLVGTGTAGDQLELLVNGQPATQLNVSIDGGWRYDLPLPAAGDYRVIVRLLAADGSEVASTNPIILTRLPSLQPMQPPAISAPAPGQVVTAGQLEFRGSGEPTRPVVLVIDGVEGGKATVGADGNWVLTAAAAAGEHDIHAYSLDENGNALMSGTLRLVVNPGAAGAVADADADGIDDAADKCVGTEAGATVDASGCVAAAATEVVQALIDQDDDGVADGVDKCRDTLKGTATDEQGCPRAGETLMTLTGLTFENNRAALAEGSAKVLEKAAEALRQNPSVKVVIEGHTDDRGDAEYNRQLSQQRAETVRDYLIGQGISAERLTAVGKGETEPLVSNRNESDRKKNRRVEMVVN